MNPLPIGAIAFFLTATFAVYLYAFSQREADEFWDFKTKSQIQQEEYQKLLPEQEGKYTLVSVDQTNEGIAIFDESKGITEIQKSVTLSAIEYAQEKFPALNIKKSPMFLLIDKDGNIVFQTESEKELETFLMSN